MADRYLSLSKNAYALEVGGPSKFFSHAGAFPVYNTVRKIDNTNYSNNTVWHEQESLAEFTGYQGKKVLGKQLVLEATDLKNIADSSYDFLISCHVIEHIANPIKALQEWFRVIKPGGWMFIVVPDKEGTFDHKRPVTTLGHVLQDYEKCISEDDLTHFNEIIELHDYEQDEGVDSAEELKKRCMNNSENRCMHHHVFDLPLTVSMLTQAGFKVEMAECYLSSHIVAIATR